MRFGTAGIQTRTFIAGISGVTPAGASPQQVVIDSNGQLGTGASMHDGRNDSPGVVRGLQSDVVTDEGVQEFLAQIPGAKLVDVGGAAHMVAGDQNDAFSEAVVEFLQHDVRSTLPDRG